MEHDECEPGKGFEGASDAECRHNECEYEQVVCAPDIDQKPNMGRAAGEVCDGTDECGRNKVRLALISNGRMSHVTLQQRDVYGVSLKIAIAV